MLQLQSYVLIMVSLVMLQLQSHYGKVTCSYLFIVCCNYCHLLLLKKSCSKLILRYLIMPVHSLFFINTSNSIIYSKFFRFNDLRDQWKRNTFEKFLLNYVNTEYDMTDSSASTEVGYLSVDDIHIVHRMMGDFLVIASGIDDIDEIVCK